ncbi:MAG: hypothetical protein ACOY93_08665 [Bacillota bacterium]
MPTYTTLDLRLGLIPEERKVEIQRRMAQPVARIVRRLLAEEAKTKSGTTQASNAQ